MHRQWLKGCLALITLIFLCGWLFQMEAYARAGSGRSSVGSRGSRSASPPKPFTAPSPTQPKPTAPTPGMTPPGARPMPPPMAQPQPSSFLRSFGGGLLGGLAGGLLFRSLFGGPSAYGGGGSAGGLGGSGISLIDILLIGGICYLIYRYIRKRRETEAMAYQGAQVEMPYQAPYPPVYDQPQAQPAGDWELEQGLGYIRQYDPSFDEARFQDWCMDAFFKVQGAWANRDMSAARTLLTEEMYRILQADCDKLKANKQINRLENIAMRSVDITEAWQESGEDYITVRVYANLLDYTVDEASGQVLAGSKTDPVKFEEYWTFTRPVGGNPWKLSAIQQPA